MGALFTKDTQAIFWNNNASAIQRMLDYDYVINRSKPSVAAIVAPTSGNKFEKFFYGPDEIMVPVFRNTTEAAVAFPKCRCSFELRIISYGVRCYHGSDCYQGSIQNRYGNG